MSLVVPGLRVVLHGAGGHAKVVADLVRCAGGVVVAFVDDRPERWGTTHFGAPVVGLQAALERFAGAAPRLVPAIGDNAARERAAARARGAGFEICGAMHPRSVVATSAIVGAGTVVMAGAVVNADARIGEGVIVNTCAVVEHDAQIGDYALLGPNSAMGGTVTVGARSLLGVGAVILPNLRVGSDVKVGAGATVTRDAPDGATLVGVPARSRGEG